MGNKKNYNKEMKIVVKSEKKLRAEKEIDDKPRLLLHACCAPCSSTCMERVREDFDTTVYFFNPNITNAEEYEKRASELERLIGLYNGQIMGQNTASASINEIDATSSVRPEIDINTVKNAATKEKITGCIKCVKGPYQPKSFIEIAKGYEKCPERGERCFRCYELRLRESGRYALENGFDYFTTTLTLSPLKDVDKLNEIGYSIAREMQEKIKWLPSDFKKEGGYARSIELSREYGLYRQDYCGCVYSKNERELQKQIKSQM